ncbi:MAG TPA: hypothetical protein DCE41_29160 [Cytophagales bacterium]|nr:hypothetical protein [Cytophagales bacterium]HAA18008.1 hypothetical protein [Cytophagales bacterium]HAP63084.1 hypothetical protein [Cytophagales bacterium]
MRTYRTHATRKLKIASTLILLFSATAGWAQEICNNGIDDDGDGFIDCYDNSCAGNSACDNFYIGNSVLCADPPNVADFAMELLWDTKDAGAPSVYGSNHTIIGDVDADGVPEVFAIRRNKNGSTNYNGDDVLYVINGDNGTLKNSVNLGGATTLFMALADVEGDGCAEIFVGRRDDDVDQFRLVALNCDLTVKWESDPIAGTTTRHESVGAIGVTDFDEDGTPEVYVKGKIFNAITGVLELDVTTGSGTIHKQHNAGPVAIDILDDSECGLCEGLELVIGSEVYALDVGNRLSNRERVLANYTASNNFITNSDGTNIHFTSIADMDQDGDLDAIITGYDKSTSRSQVWYWDVQDEQDTILLTVPLPLNEQGSGNGTRWGPGRVNIADLDGDNDPDLSFNNDDVFAYTIDFATREFVNLWIVDITDVSAFTGTAVFDFNGDGAFEVVYRSTNKLYIIDGIDGSLNNTTTQDCPSGTYGDYPIVADVNGDGVTEICVACQPTSSNGQDNNGFLRLYGAAVGQKWVPARRLWNQHGYFNVNINDDLTIPRELQKHNAVFSDTLCDLDVNGNPIVAEVRPLNSFLNQAPYLDERGCLEFPQSDLTFIENSLVLTSPPTCGETEIGLEIDIINSGDIVISGDLPITFYDGDPELPSTGKLNTQIIALNAPVGDTITYALTAEASIAAFGGQGNFTLYVVINDDGTASPGINYPATATIEECTYSNNIASIEIEPTPNTISALAVNPNLKCVDSLSSNTGSASAFYLDSLGNPATTGFTFYWFDGATPSETADFTGPNYANLEDGFYSVYATNIDLGCNSDTVSVEITRLTEDSTLTARIDELTVNTSCGSPNGELTAIVNPVDDNDSVGDPANQYSFEWGKSVVIGDPGSIFSNSQVATGIESGFIYTVRVTENATGCDVLATLDSTGEGLIFPTVRVDIATDNNYCVGGNGFGLVSVGGDTTNYSFQWFDNEWKPSPDHLWAKRNSMVGGDYFVIATSNSTQCADSTMLTITDSLIYPSLTLYENIGNTSCDPNNTNGRLVVVSAEDTPYSWSDTVGSVTDNFAVAGATSVVSSNRFQMTPNENNQAGAAWFNDKVSLNQDFIFDFIINLGDRDGNGADGIGFVFHNDPDGRFAYGEAGQGMGASTLNPGVAIEFDSWDNGDGFGDIDEDHVAVLNTSTRNNYGNPLVGPIRMDAVIDNFEDGADHDVQISWDASATRLLVILDGVQLIDYTRDLVNDFFSGDPYVFFGFTSSTGGARNDQQVELVGISATILSPETNTGIEWFDGANTVNSLNGGAFDGDSLAIGLDAGTYRVRATSGTTGCVTEEDYEVADDRVIPSINSSRVTVTPNSICDTTGVNGALSVANNAVSPQPNQINNISYRYEWWDGDNAIGLADYSGQSITGLIDGRYTLVVTDDSTSCATPEETFTVNDTKIYPVITFTDSSYQTSCDPILKNAFATGQATMPSGGEPSSGYTYAFYQGATTNATALLANDSTDDELAAGIYTLYAMNNVTGCENTEEITLVDSLTTPLLDTTLIAVTNWMNCDTLTFDGEVAAGNGSITNYNGAPYTFNWYDGSNASAPIAISDSVYSGLGDGKYTLKVISDSTACESDPVTVTVLQEVVYPVVTFPGSSDQTSCTTPNGWARGQATMPSGPEPAAGYSYTFFQGATIFGTVLASDSLIEGQTSGTYTLRAINNNSQCETIEQITLIDTLIAPIIDSASVINSPWTNCNVDSLNGSLTAGITAIQNYNGASYSFQWYDGGSASAPIASTDSIYDMLADGTYTLVAISDSTNCESDPQSFIVEQSIILPQIAFTDFSDQTSCDTIPNGWLLGQATMPSGPEPALGYAYAIYEGATTNVSALLANDSTIDSLAAGLYTLYAQNLQTLCDASAQITLVDTLTYPIIDSAAVVVTPWTNCNTDSLNGALTAGIAAIQNYNGAPYSFQWYDGPNAFMPVASTDSAYGSLGDGTYTLVAISDSTACVSAPQSFEVEQQVTAPIAAVNSQYQFACDPVLANGWLSATASEVDLSIPTNGYSFEFFEGQNTLLSSRIDNIINPSDSALSDSLSAGTYTLLLTNLDNSCTETTEWTIVDSLVDPIITNALIDLAAYTLCLAPNGAADATNAVSQPTWGEPVNGYAYNWHEGDSALVWYLDTTATTAVYAGLLPGDYTLTVSNNDTGCESEESTVTVIDSTNTIFVDEFRTNLAGTCFGSTDPTLATAVISAEATPTANIGGFTYEWYRGQEPFPNPTPFGSETLVASDSSKTDTLSSDLYTVRMINLDDGCFLDSTFFIDYNTGHTIAFDSTVNSTICEDPITQFGNGQLFTEIAITAAGADVRDYLFELYEGNNITGTPDTTFATDQDTALIDYPIFAHLAPGIYTLTIREDNVVKFPDNCPANPVTFEILQDVPDPVVTVNAQADESCIDSLANGMLSAVIDSDPMANGGYLIQWYNYTPTDSADTVTGPINANNEYFIDSLLDAQYMVFVRDSATNCEARVVGEVIADPDIITLDIDSHVITQDDQNCSPANGFIRLDSLFVDDVTVDTSNFQFTWYMTDTTMALGTDNLNERTGLTEGTYLVDIDYLVTGCPTAGPLQVVLENVAEAPTVRIAQNVEDVFCGTSGSGELRAFVDSAGIEVTVGYDFEWYAGDDTVGAPFDTNPVISNLDGGSYTVAIIDITTPNQNCIGVATYVLPETPSTVSIDSSDIVIAHQSNCSPEDGAITINSVREDGTSINPLTDYSFEWFNDDLTSYTTDTINSVDSLAFATYQVRVTNWVTSCVSDLVSVEVEDDREDPAARIRLDSIDTYCGDAGSGVLSAYVDSLGISVTSGFTYRWFEGSDTTGTLIGETVSIDSLNAGTYTVRIRDISAPHQNCVGVTTYTLNEDPALITIDSTEIIVTHQLNCAPADGAIEISDVRADGQLQGLNDYIFTWLDTNGDTLTGQDSSNFYGPLAFGNYQVVISDTVTFCVSDTVSVEIEDRSVDPVVRIALVSQDEFCDGAGNGVIRAFADSAGLEITTGYTYQWYEGTDVTGTVIDTDFQLEDLNAGTYTVRMEDASSPYQSCFGVASYTLTEDLAIVSIEPADLTITHQQDCSPEDGAILVNAVREDDVAGTDLSGYTFAWFDNSNPPARIDSTNNTSSIGPLPFGTYQLQVTNNGTSCVSDFVSIEVEDQRQIPVVAFVTSPDASCPDDPTFGTGILEMSVYDEDSTTFANGYLFEVFFGDSTNNPVNASQYVVGTESVSVSMLGAGEYTVVVTDTASPGLNCSYSATTIVLQEDNELPAINGFTTTSQTDCGSPNGTITVDGLSQTSSLGFTYNWYDGTYDSANIALQEITGQYTNLSASQPYFVTVYNEETRCLSQVYEVDVEDGTEPPVIRLADFTLPLRCANADDGGILTVSGDGSTNSSEYQFEWFRGPMPLTGGVIGNEALLTGLIDDTYSVRVTNLATSCVDSAEYQLVDEILQIPLIAFASPRGNCITTNGILTSFVEQTLNTDGLNYQYDWTNVAGTTINSGIQTAGTQYQVFGRDIGRYTVVATDIADPTCISDPIEVTVEDTRFTPDISIVEDQVVTYCVNPNGQFSAYVDSTEINGYFFEWFAGTNTNNVSPISVGNVIQGLEGNNTYTVRVTNVVNQCDDELSEIATDNIQPLPELTASVLSQNTTCIEFSPNGSAGVSIDGNLGDYVFSWYEGADVNVAPFTRGATATGLFEGQYSVNAQDKVTGCISNSDLITIVDQRSYPEFTTEIISASCDNENGEITLEMITEKPILTVIWDDGTQVFNGNVLNGRPSGEYEVTVVDVDGCTTTENLIIPTTIEVFNSVSPNGDGRNDEFFIGCLEEFEQNNIKIYNRAGALVFEMNDYGISGDPFIGEGNRGVYLGGQSLPEGTYFYIIDKNNGSKPETGYLELIR